MEQPENDNDRYYLDEVPVKKVFSRDRYAPIDPAKIDETLCISVKIAVFPLRSNVIIINLPGNNSNFKGREGKYIKTANELINKNLGAVILAENRSYKGYDYSDILIEVLKDLIKFAMNNSSRICGHTNPDIYLMGYSAGASAVAAVCSIYNRVKRILIIAPSGDIDEFFMKKHYVKYTGQVYILIGQNDHKVGSYAGKYFYRLAKKASIKKLDTIPFCDHYFNGSRNGRIRSEAPFRAFSPVKKPVSILDTVVWLILSSLSPLYGLYCLFRNLRKKGGRIRSYTRAEKSSRMSKKSLCRGKRAKIKNLRKLNGIRTYEKGRLKKRMYILLNPLQTILPGKIVKAPWFEKFCTRMEREIKKSDKLINRQMIELLYLLDLDTYMQFNFWDLLGNIAEKVTYLPYMAYELLDDLYSKFMMYHYVSNEKKKIFWSFMNSRFLNVIEIIYSYDEISISHTLRLLKILFSQMRPADTINENLWSGIINHLFLKFITNITIRHPGAAANVYDATCELFSSVEGISLTSQGLWNTLLSLSVNCTMNIESTIFDLKHLLDEVSVEIKKYNRFWKIIEDIPAYTFNSASLAFKSLYNLFARYKGCSSRDETFWKNLENIKDTAGKGCSEVYDIYLALVKNIRKSEHNNIESIESYFLQTVSAIHNYVSSGEYKAYKAFNIILDEKDSDAVMNMEFWNLIISNYFLRTLFAINDHPGTDNMGTFICLAGMLHNINMETLYRESFWLEQVDRWMVGLCILLNDRKKNMNKYYTLRKVLDYTDPGSKLMESFWDTTSFIIKKYDHYAYKLFDAMPFIVPGLTRLKLKGEPCFSKAMHILFFLIRSVEKSQSLSSIERLSIQEWEDVWPVIKQVVFAGEISTRRIGELIRFEGDLIFKVLLPGPDILKLLDRELGQPERQTLETLLHERISQLHNRPDPESMCFSIRKLRTPLLYAYFFSFIDEEYKIPEKLVPLYITILKYIYKNAKEELDAAIDKINRVLLYNNIDVKNYPEIREVVEIFKMKRYVRGRLSFFFKEMLNNILDHYNTKKPELMTGIFRKERALEIFNYISSVKEKLNKEQGLPYFIPQKKNNISMGVWRTLRMDALENYLTEGHLCNKSEFKETYLGVIREKCYRYEYAYGFMVWIPNYVYNNAIFENKVFVGKRSKVDEEVVLNKDLKKETLKIYFLHELNYKKISVQARKGISVLKVLGKKYLYLEAGEQAGVILDELTDLNRIILLLKKHKERESSRLIVTFEGPNNFKGMKKLFTAPPFAKEFLDTNFKDMERASLAGYLQKKFVSNAHILSREYLEERYSRLQFVKNRTYKKGSQEAYLVRINNKKYYAKVYKNPDQAKAEYLAWLIYRELDVPVPRDMKIVAVNGKTAVASLWVRGTGKIAGHIWEKKKLALDFAASALIQNRDQGKVDNYLRVKKEIFVIDLGGSFIFKSTGGIKGGQEDKAGNLPFSLDNFKEMLKEKGPHGSKAFYRNLRSDRAVLNNVIYKFCTKLTPEIIIQLVRSVNFNDAELTENIITVLLQTLKYLFGIIDYDILGIRGSREIAGSTKAVKQICFLKISREKKWSEIYRRLPPGLLHIFKAPSGRSSLEEGRKCDLKTHTRDVFLCLDPGEEETIFLNHPKVILLMAALFHDTGKFISHKDKGFQNVALELVHGDTGDPACLADLGNLKKINHNTLSAKLAEIYLPFMGFSTEEAALAAEVINKNRIGETASETVTEDLIFKHASILTIDTVLQPSDSFLKLFPGRGLKDIQTNVLKLSKQLYIADVYVSGTLRQNVLKRSPRGWVINKRHMKLWALYERFLYEEYEKEVLNGE